MEWYEALILGLIQGLTEFLPVSSSGHLIIGQTLFGTNSDENLLFAVIVHAATVCSTLVVLRKEIADLFKGCFSTKAWNPQKDYVAKIFVSMIPVFIIGVFFKDYVEAVFGEGMIVVGCCLIVTALLLGFSYYAKPRQKETISYRDAFIIGLSQAVAVLPGLSRSGTTIATGLLLGNKKEQVANFSFLMVIIPILGQALLDLLDMVSGNIPQTPVLSLVLGFLAAFLSGCVACKFMIGIVKRGKLIYFAIYCLLMGAFSIIYSL